MLFLSGQGSNKNKTVGNSPSFIIEKCGIAPSYGAIPHLKNLSFLDSRRDLSGLITVNSFVPHKIKHICKTQSKF